MRKTGKARETELLVTLKAESSAHFAAVSRADAAERALRDLTLDRDRWRRRAEIAEAALSSVGKLERA